MGIIKCESQDTTLYTVVWSPPPPPERPLSPRSPVRSDDIYRPKWSDCSHLGSEKGQTYDSTRPWHESFAGKVCKDLVQ